jgi:hypothetical protein
MRKLQKLIFMSLEHPKSVMMEKRDVVQANPDYKGVCHVALAQEGHCRPGEVLRNFFLQYFCTLCAS